MKIKFRVWDKNKNRYEPKYLLAIDEVGDLWRIDSTDAIDFTSERDRYIIEQFTGLYDKNGKEIYEGDIVEEEIDSNSETTDGVFKYEVYWNEDELCWSVNPIGMKSVHSELYQLNSSRTVIGNIHNKKIKEFKYEG